MCGVLYTLCLCTQCAHSTSCKVEKHAPAHCRAQMIKQVEDIKSDAFPLLSLLHQCVCSFCWAQSDVKVLAFSYLCRLCLIGFFRSHSGDGRCPSLCCAQVIALSNATGAGENRSSTNDYKYDNPGIHTHTLCSTRRRNVLHCSELIYFFLVVSACHNHQTWLFQQKLLSNPKARTYLLVTK